MSYGNKEQSDTDTSGRIKGVHPRIVIKFRDDLHLPYEKGAERTLTQLGLAPRHMITEAAQDTTLAPAFGSVAPTRITEFVRTAVQYISSYRPPNFLSFFAMEAVLGCNLQALLQELMSWGRIVMAIDRCRTQTAFCWILFSIFLAAVPQTSMADDILRLMPFETFECEGAECPVDFTEASGQDSTASGLVAESRSEAGAFGQRRRGRATVGMKFKVCEAAQASILVRGDYLGRLRGSYGGSVNRGIMELYSVLRNLTTGEVVDRALIQAEEERGDLAQTNITFIPQNNLGQPGADTTGAVVSGPIEAGHTYMAGLELRTDARGAAPRAYADLKSGNFQSQLFMLRVELMPELEDSDGDGLYDVWEEEGLKDCEGNVLVNLPEFGAQVEKKDVFVEYDWLPGAAPTKADIDFAKTRFAAAPGDSGVDRIDNLDGSDGINLWIDTGNLSDNGVLVGDNFGGGEEIQLADVPNGVNIPRVGGDANANGIADFREVKDKYFDKARRAIFHYAISGPSGSGEAGPPVPGVNSCSDGVDNDSDGLIDGADILDCFSGGQAAGGANIFVSFADAGTFMHELGHTLGLHHGGNEPNNCKPNYLSIMNYVYAGGIPRDDDGDGNFESRTEDFSAIPTSNSNNAAAPLGDLVENQLDESAIVDASDPVHGIRWVDANGIGRTSRIDAPVNWSGNFDQDGNQIIEGDVDGSGTIEDDETLVTANLNRGDENGRPTACENDSANAGHPSNETLRGAHDWYTIVFRFTPDSVIAGDSIDDIIEEPFINIAEIEAVYNATDLAVEKSVDPNPWVGGQTVNYNINVSNKGPNGATDVKLIELPPDGVNFVDLPDQCEIHADSSLQCKMDPIAVGETATVSIGARTPIATDCGRNQFTYLSNTVEVINEIGRELAPRDNRSTARHAILCPVREYPAKFVCGVQSDPKQNGLLQAAYGTSVNIHNPNDEEVFVFAKLTVARPSQSLQPGPVHPIGLFSFNYDESVVVGCDIIRDRLFPDGYPEGLIDGFLVLQAARSLDVVAVHTAGHASADGKDYQTAQTSIDVERVAERRREPPDPQADLVTTILQSDLVCGSSLECKMDLAYQVENRGDADATAFVATALSNTGVELAIVQWNEGLSSQANEIRPLGLAVSQIDLREGLEICIGADIPDNVVQESDETNNTDCRFFSLP